jgi:hypothetical protein
MSLEIVEASAREVFEAYAQARENGDREASEFWRIALIERLVVINGHTQHRERTARADSGEP